MKIRIFHAVFLILLLHLPVFGQVPLSFSELIAAGTEKINREEWAEAESSFRQATLIEPKNVRAWYGLGESLYELRRYEEAIVSFKKILALDISEANAHFYLGNCYYYLNNYELGERSYSAYVALEPGYETGHYWHGICLYELERFADAEKEFRKAIALNGKDSSAYGYLGECLSSLGREAEAAAAFEKSLALGGKGGTNQFALGCSSYRAHDYAKARDLLQKYVSSSPDDAQGHFWLGCTLFELRLFDQATNSFTRSIALDPGNDVVLEWLGSALIYQHSYVSALEAFKQAALLKPEYYRYHYLCGDALFRAHQYPQAVIELEKAHALNKKDRLTRLKLFSTYLITAKYREASSLYPVGVTVGIGLLLLSFIVGSVVMLKKSFRITEQESPGLGFSIAWVLLYLESQMTCTLFGPAFGSGMGSALIAATLLSPIPMLAAALLAFPSHPWGSPFSLPREFSWKKLGFCWLIMFGVNIVSSAYVALMTALTHYPRDHAKNVRYIQEMLQAHPYLAMVAVVLVAPMAEEVMFRGLLFGSLRRWLDVWPTIIVTAILFAAIHLDFLYFVPLFGIGMVLGWARYKSGSIWLPLAVHISQNGLACLALYVAQVLKVHLGK